MDGEFHRRKLKTHEALDIEDPLEQNYWGQSQQVYMLENNIQIKGIIYILRHLYHCIIW